VPLALACVVFLLSGAWRLAAALDLDGTSETAAATVLLWICAQVGLVLVLGFAGVLTAAWLAGGTAVAGGGAWAVSVLSRTRRPRAAGGLRAAGAALRRHPTLVLLAMLVAAEYLFRAAIAVRLPTLDYDGLWYHLTTVDVWHQNHAVTQVPEVVWSSADPADSEATTAYTSILAGSTALANLVQFMYAALGALSVAALCRSAGLSVRSALLAGLLVLATPIVFVMAPLAHVDLAAGMTVLAAWHFVLAAFRNRAGRRRFSGRHLVLGGAAVGLALGTKDSGALFAGWLALVTLVGLVLRHRAGVLRTRAAIASTAAAVALTVGLGGWVYIRNVVTHGNPLWPLAYLGLPGLPGALGYLNGSPFGPARITRQNLLVGLWRSWSHDLTWHNYHYSRSLGGFGMQFLLLMLPASIVAVALLRRQRRPWTLYAFLVPGLLFVLAIPKDWQARYVLYVAGVAAVGLAVALDAAPRRVRAGLHAALLAMTVFSAVAASWLSNYYISNTARNAYDVARLIAQPASVRDRLSYWALDPELPQLQAGTCVVVPPDLQRDFQSVVFYHLLVGSSFQRRLVATASEPATAAAAAAQLRAHRCRYLVVASAAPLGRRLATAAAPLRRLGPAYPGGWLYELPASG
jgi:hypothetical protein